MFISPIYINYVFFFFFKTENFRENKFQRKLVFIWSTKKASLSKAELLQEGIFFLIHLFARDILVMKKLEIEKTKPTFIISVLKVEY